MTIFDRLLIWTCGLAIGIIATHAYDVQRADTRMQEHIQTCKDELMTISYRYDASTPIADIMTDDTYKFAKWIDCTPQTTY